MTPRTSPITATRRAGLGSAAAWPVVARAQQTAMPVIGVLSAQSAEVDYKDVTVPFLQGLKETGYVEGQTVVVVYRYAENQVDRLPALCDSGNKNALAAVLTQLGPKRFVFAVRAITEGPLQDARDGISPWKGLDSRNVCADPFTRRAPAPCNNARPLNARNVVWFRAIFREH
jgi:hypothetical protein